MYLAGAAQSQITRPLRPAAGEPQRKSMLKGPWMGPRLWALMGPVGTSANLFRDTRLSRS